MNMVHSLTSRYYLVFTCLGEIGIDDMLIKDKFSDKEEIFQMNNGCICCTVRGDLIRTLGNLMEQSDKARLISYEPRLHFMSAPRSRSWEPSPVAVLSRALVRLYSY